MENPRINLLFIVNSLEFGGAEKHVVTLVNNLDTSRFRVSLAWLKNKEALLPQLDRGMLKGRGYCCHVSQRIDMRAVRRLAAYLEDEAIDIVVCTNTYSLLYGWLARRRAKRSMPCPRLIEIFHTTDITSFKEHLEMLFYRPLFLACDVLVYVCESQRKHWRARALRARNDAVINNGIDVGHFADRYTEESKSLLRRSYGFEPDDYIVGLCAAMRPEKAHGDLLHAIAGLHAMDLKMKCLFIGDGPERARIEEMIRSMSLTEHVRITGFMEDVRPAVAACDVMAIVSHQVETFSIAALEAMALGKPMVMTRIGGAAEQVIHGENGYLYHRGDIAALANALRKLSDRQQSRRMGERARAITAGQFSIEAMIDAYAALFDAQMRPSVSCAEYSNGA
jgi:glycosyltransferase involved in cell wall biosynthesis